MTENFIDTALKTEQKQKIGQKNEQKTNRKRTEKGFKLKETHMSPLPRRFQMMPPPLEVAHPLIWPTTNTSMNMASAARSAAECEDRFYYLTLKNIDTMNKYNQKETMLAEALEEKEQRIKELTDKVDVLTKENKALSTELKSLSEKPMESPKSMLTWEDFQKEINVYKKRGGELASQYFDLKSKYDKLSEERRYWAT